MEVGLLLAGADVFPAFEELGGLFGAGASGDGALFGEDSGAVVCDPVDEVLSDCGRLSFGGPLMSSGAL